MPTYVVRIAIEGMYSSWRVTKVSAATAERAVIVAEHRERQEGYNPLALRAENAKDAHDVASKGVWPFAVGA